MTSGEIYRKDKEYYDSLAKEYIDENLKIIDDVCYVPFAMKTNYSRAMVKKISDDEYIYFYGYVKDIVKDEFDYLQYCGDTNNRCKTYTKNEIIEECAFEFSLNPYFREELEKRGVA